MDFDTKVIAILVAGLTAVGVVHGTAHVMVVLIPPVADLAFIIAVVFAAPLVALALRLRGRRRGADLLLLASMIGSLAYGVGNDHVLVGPDNVSAVSPEGWGSVFQASAALLAAVEVFGLAAALAALRRG